MRRNRPQGRRLFSVRSRIDWKYLLGLELTDPGFDFSILSEFHDRLLTGNAEDLLLHELLVMWFDGRPLAKTRASCFAALAPDYGLDLRPRINH